MSTPNFAALLAWIEVQLTENLLERLSLTGPTGPEEQRLQKYTVRPVQIGQQKLLQWTAIDARKRQTHENLEIAVSLQRFAESLGTRFLSAHVLTTQEESQIRFGKKQKLQWIRKARQNPPATVSLSHNASRQYLFPDGTPCPFLIETGLMTEAGQVRKSKFRKFRQINRFAEFVYDLREHFPRDRPMRVVDYGCGKSYLTFAIRHLLVEQLGLQVEMLGLDTNPEVIASCQNTKNQLGWTDLDFQVSEISQANLQPPVDLAIWLHACDTATDDALIQSIQAETRLILAVPCCQHELFKQLDNPTWQPMLKHGILRERLAALITDALRAELLEAAGYRTQVMEFIDLEHTAKNLLIRAIRPPLPLPAGQRESAFEAYRQLKETLNIQRFHLERFLPQGLPQ